MQLVKKITALHPGNLRFRRPLGQWPKGVERIKSDVLDLGLAAAFISLPVCGNFDLRKTSPVQFRQEVRPGNEERIVRGNFLRVNFGGG